MDFHDAEIVTKKSFRCRFFMLLANAMLFADGQCYSTRIESGNRKSKQSLTDTMDSHNVEIMTEQSLGCRFSVFLDNNVIFAGNQFHNSRVERGNRKIKQLLTDIMDFHYVKIVTKQSLRCRFSMLLTNDVIFTDEQ